jgi:Zn-dependent peptidase ImmA (M78 family)
MNTTEKGNQLEEYTYNYLQTLIKNGALGVIEKNCKIFKQKAYPSLERGLIYFDVSIEVYFENQETPSFLFLFECKNYTKKVPVDDIQVFSDNVSKVAHHNSKAICITTKGFQSGAEKLAKSRKIGLWKIIDNGHESILNRRFNREIDKTNEIISCLTDPTYIPMGYGSNFIQTPFRLTTCLIDLFSDLLMDNYELRNYYLKLFKKQKIPYISKNNLSNMGNVYFEKYSENSKLNLDFIAKDLNLEVIKTDSLISKNLIAEINFRTNTIILFGINTFSVQQINFAFAHELAHKILKHDKFFTSETQLVDQQSTGHTNLISDRDINRLEFQANFLAACILLPDTLLKKTFLSLLKYYDIKNKGFCPLYIDDQPCNKDNYAKICIPIAEFFSVSQETLKIRLEELGLAKFERSIDKN